MKRKPNVRKFIMQGPNFGLTSNFVHEILRKLWLNCPIITKAELNNNHYISCQNLAKIHFSLSGYALNTDRVEGMESEKAPTTRTSIQKRQRHHFHEPYSDVRGDLESREGVATLSSNFWFRKLLKDATWQILNLKPCGISAKDPGCHRFRVEYSSFSKSALWKVTHWPQG